MEMTADQPSLFAAVIKKKITETIKVFSTPPQETFTEEPHIEPLLQEPESTSKHFTMTSGVPDPLPPLPCPMPKAKKNKFLNPETIGIKPR